MSTTADVSQVAELTAEHAGFLAESPAGPRTPAAGVSFGRVIRSEWTKLRSVRSTWYSVATTFLVMVGLGALISYVSVANWDSGRPAFRAHFDATSASLVGVILAQVALSVMGVLAIAGEYSTGQIRTTLVSVPRRWQVLLAKGIVVGGLSMVVMAVSSFTAFFVGQSILSSKSISVSLSDPGVLRAVLGTIIYVTLVTLLGMALGALLRSTPAAISTLLGTLLVLPTVAGFLPGTWGEVITKWLPSEAGQQVMLVHGSANAFGPWQGALVLAGYVVIAFASAATVLSRRDA